MKIIHGIKIKTANSKWCQSEVGKERIIGKTSHVKSEQRQKASIDRKLDIQEKHQQSLNSIEKSSVG